MSRRSMLGLVVLLILSIPQSATAEGADSDRIEDFGSVVAVARDANFPIASLMRAECEFVHRVQRPDGSAIETQLCHLSDEPVMIEAFQGAPPSSAFLDAGGSCIWLSDYWFYADGSDVYASSYSLVVTPSGQVLARSTYPAVPLVCG